MLCIIGTGGMARDTWATHVDASRQGGYQIDPVKDIIFMVDKEYYASDSKVLGSAVHVYDLNTLKSMEVFVAIGDPIARRRFVQRLPEWVSYKTIIHPSANIFGQNSQIGTGSIVMPGSSISVNVTVGAHAHINLKATISHDCVIGDFFSIAPGGTVCGDCNIGEAVNIGANTSVRDKVNITDNVQVGMSSAVLKDINEAGIYIGSPCRRLLQE